MSGKLLNALSDENHDLRKQIGCMTGIFQMFDRHHLLAARRLRKRLPSGDDILLDSRETNLIPRRVGLEKNLSRSLNENQRISLELSRPSFSSSSCSSSFSSLECGKSSTQQEPSILDQTTFPHRSVKNQPVLQVSENESRFVPSSPCQYVKKLSSTSSQQSLDFRDVVKESISRESRGLSIKTTNKEDIKRHVMKHNDSPRPLSLSELTDTSHLVRKNEKPKMPEDLDKSIRVLPKQKEAPRYFSENRALKLSEKNDFSFFPIARDACHLTCDGKEISRSSMDSREQNKCLRLRELPRLSLDSRQSSMASNLYSKSNSLMNDLESQTYRPLTLQQDLDTPRKTSVVAKLMGLKEMPLGSGMQNDIHLTKRCAIDDSILDMVNPSDKSLKTSEKSTEERCSCSPKCSDKSSAVQKIRPADPWNRTIPNSKMSIEAAPWKQSKNQPKTQSIAFKSGKCHTRQQHDILYAEIGKKLKDLEFSQSNKDLKALKHILHAIQAKGLQENGTDESLISEAPYKNNCDQARNATNQSPRPADKHEICNSHLQKGLARGSTTSRPLEVPIVVVKPTRSIYRTGISTSSVIPLDCLSSFHKIHNNVDKKTKGNSFTHVLDKQVTTVLNLKEPDVKPKGREKNSSQNTRVSLAQISPRLRQPMKDNSGSTIRMPGSSNSRQQQKRFEPEKKSHPPVSSYETAKSKKLPAIKLISDSLSPRNRSRTKSEHMQHDRGRLNETNSDTTSPSNVNEESLGTESSISSVSQLKVASTNQSIEFISKIHQRAPDYAVGGITPILKDKKSMNAFGEDATEHSIVSPDQPSPVSVLDASFYGDDHPHPPVNRISDSYRRDDVHNLGATSGIIWKTAGPDKHLPNNPICDPASTMCNQKLNSIENLLQKLRKLSLSKGGESTDASHLTSLHELEDPDRRYVSKVLLASGFLDRTIDGPMPPIPPHESSYVMDPAVFSVLELANSCSAKTRSLHDNTVQSKGQPEKLHSRLIFDTVNEILTRKLASAGAGFFRHGNKCRLTDGMPTGQRLLEEVILEIERLQAFGHARDGLDEEDDSLRPILCVDMAHWLEEWNKYGKKATAGLVLDIERCIFRDLITEVVSGEAAAFVLAPNPNRHRLQ